MIHFERPILLVGLFAVPALVLLWRRACGIAADSARLLGMSRAASGRHNTVRGALRIGALATALVGVSGPFWTGLKDTAGTAGQVVFVLDVSRSMLAQDVPPSRLSVAKDAIESNCDMLRGDAVGLVAAASAPVVVCPLTTDKSVFHALLGRLDTDWASSAGTELAPALRLAGRLLERSGAAHGVIVLVSDGEDHGPPPADAAAELLKHGIVTHCICIGGEAPAPVLVRNLSGAHTPKLDAQGNPVTTRARPAAMRAWAAKGGGRSWAMSPTATQRPGTRRAIISGPSAARLSGALLRQGFLGHARASLDLSPYFYLLAILLLAVEMVIGIRPPRIRR